MKVLFMGTPDFAEKCLAKLYAEGFDVCGVFSQPDKPRGRGMKLTPSPVKALAVQHGTPVFTPRKLRDGTALATIKELAPDVIAVVAYGRILPDDILDYPRLGCINMHGSLLPKYRGAAPVQWSVINGEKTTGVTAMYMASELDAGDMISAVDTEIGESETFGELYSRMGDMAAELLCDTLRDIETGKTSRTPQDHAAATFAPPITKDMTRIDWGKSSTELANLIRGLNPAPAAVCELCGTNFKLFKATAFEESSDLAPGELVGTNKKGIIVSCGSGTLLIEELQAPGGKRMRAADYLRGHPLCR